MRNQDLHIAIHKRYMHKWYYTGGDGRKVRMLYKRKTNMDKVYDKHIYHNEASFCTKNIH